ncbi:hypothetical protein SKAU_G00282690 [Synaphobranchus kaupii]|uniref:Uncharacterized protein n=1 Tax=Synaphobranchus kaupii TaxID=118154 RepID=A0A9Q1IP60_SYNKA|nr:hypothetical protein SKAU_G00282690 [Synaphobranchus kaupii]
MQAKTRNHQARIRYEELKESSNQQLEVAAQTAQEDRDSESRRYCSIVQALEEELAALTDMCKSKDRRLVDMAEESERREEELIAMSERCDRKEKHLAAAADQFEYFERKLAAMTELCQSNKDQLLDMEEMYEVTMKYLVDETISGEDRLESLETMTQLVNNKEEELAAMASTLEVSEKDTEEKLQAMAKLNKATMDNLVDERRVAQERIESWKP